MSLQLTSQLEAKIEEIMAAGDYPDPEAVLIDALSLLEERERPQQLEWLRAKMASAAEQVKRGEVVEFTDEFLEELDREVDERLRRGDLPSSYVCP